VELEALAELVAMESQFAEVLVVVCATTVLRAPNARRDDIKREVLGARLSDRTHSQGGKSGESDCEMHVDSVGWW
jgi:hypothetical protein